jgi:hypothetical protein
MPVSVSAMFIPVHDADAALEKVRASGAEVLQEPADQPWGVRGCALRDPSGNFVRHPAVELSRAAIVVMACAVGTVKRCDSIAQSLQFVLVD